ncbi:MAG: dTMP kinase [Treponema sp.]|jgi:dTMP kinase|nr:dTMP kinase [Treponema sp.]
MEIVRNFAVFEGGDGSGTTTQLKLLEEKFAGGRDGPDLFATSEPTGGPVGRLIRSVLKGEPILRPETLARLFAADRNEHLYGPGGIMEHLGRGAMVISDRYVFSSLVYQGLECGEYLPAALNASFPAPELIIFFDLDPEIARERLRDRPALEIFEYLEFQMKVRDRYRALLPRYRDQGVRVEEIDAALPPEEVARRVWRALQKMPIMGG